MVLINCVLYIMKVRVNFRSHEKIKVEYDTWCIMTHIHDVLFKFNKGKKKQFFL